jgi:signal transduction histidine kinase
LKVFRFRLLLLITSISACKEQHKVVPVITTSPDYKKAKAFLNLNDDSAFYYFNKVATSSSDSLQIAMAYNNMAVIESERGDYFGSQESLLTSLKYLNEQKETNYNCLVADYNQLGRNSSNLKNYEAAIEYYNLALKFSKKPVYIAIALNNKAVTYQNMRQYTLAIDVYRSIIQQSRKNKKEYARILSNLAKTRWLQNPGYQAAPDLLMALQIRKDEKDDWGLNSSYAHLADYYLHSRPDSALTYADKMYAIAQKLNSPDDELEALQKLIILSPPKDVKEYFIRYQFLSDSVQTIRNASKNQFALIRYDAEKNKIDNIRLQKDNAEKKVQIIQQRVLISGTLIIFIVIICAVIAWSRKRKRYIERESQNTIRESELKTSRKVHDVVANGLYSVMTDIQHQENIEKGQLLDKIEILYEQSRDISYERPEPIRADFQAAVASLLASFANQDTKVLIVGNHKDLWNKMKGHTKIELEYVLKELMINMKKHSSARNVIVRFEWQVDCLKMQYKDDGIGLPSTFQYGNGLTNTENRIKSIGGRIIFDKNTLKGLEIQVYLPISDSA